MEKAKVSTACFYFVEKELGLSLKVSVPVVIRKHSFNNYLNNMELLGDYKKMNKGRKG